MTVTPLFVYGSFGHGNLGDELVPDCLAAALNAAGYPATPIPVTRFDGDLTWPGVINRSAAPARLAEAGGRLIVTGGGIVEPRAHSCMNRAFDLAATVPGTAVDAFAFSVEPGVDFGWRDRRRLRRQLDQIGTAHVRDELSAETLLRLAPGHPVRVVGDIALWSAAGTLPDAVTALLSGAGTGIAVILQTTWDKTEVFPWLVPELVTLARELDLPVTILPFAAHDDRDRKMHSSLAAALREAAPDRAVADLSALLPGVLTPAVAAALLEQAELTISTRLHGCVLSYAMKTPFVALSYHPKLAGFARTVDRQSALLPARPPSRQSARYGYSFADLGLRPGDLVARAGEVLDDRDFPAIAFYRRRQAQVLGDMLRSER